MLSSPDKLVKGRLLVILAIILSFMCGWYSKGKWVVFRAEPHYTERSRVKSLLHPDRLAYCFSSGTILLESEGLVKRDEKSKKYEWIVPV